MEGREEVQKYVQDRIYTWSERGSEVPPKILGPPRYLGPPNLERSAGPPKIWSPQKFYLT